MIVRIQCVLYNLQHYACMCLIISHNNYATVVAGCSADGTRCNFIGNRFLSRTELLMICKSNAGCFDLEVFVNSIQYDPV